MSSLSNIIENEIAEKKGHIITDNVILSIGEIINLYKDSDLNLNPDFQRFFRWNNEQKSRLIESIFLGLPIPSFFVYEDKNSIWEVLDGLQRISSLLQYTGELKNENNNILPPLKLEGLQYLPSLEGTTWDDLSEKMQRGFKKNSLPFIVMKNETTEIKKYQLFQRLNRGGSTLSEAEVRSCIILMAPYGKELMKAIDSMVKNKDFQNSIWLSNRKLKEKAVAITSLIIPLFISAFSRSADLADAMEARSYNPYAKRTRYRKLKWHFKDTIMLFLTLGLMIAFIVLSALKVPLDSILLGWLI